MSTVNQKHNKLSLQSFDNLKIRLFLLGPVSCQVSKFGKQTIFEENNIYIDHFHISNES